MSDIMSMSIGGSLVGGDSFVLPICDDEGELKDTGEDWILASGVRGGLADFWELLVTSGRGGFESLGPPFPKKDMRLFCFIESEDALALGAISRRLRNRE